MAWFRVLVTHVSLHGLGGAEVLLHLLQHSLGGEDFELVQHLCQAQAETLASAVVGGSKTTDQPLHRVVDLGGQPGINLGVLFKLCSGFIDSGLSFLQGEESR